jgi:hypothetical protein
MAWTKAPSTPSSKLQAPNIKLQGSSKSQGPNQAPIDVVAIQGGALKFGAWNFSGAWSLGFGASIENSEELKIYAWGAPAPSPW